MLSGINGHSRSLNSLSPIKISIMFIKNEFCGHWCSYMPSDVTILEALILTCKKQFDIRKLT